MRSLRTLLVLALTVAVVTVAAVAVMTRGNEGGDRLITVSASAEQRVPPDVAITRLGVTERAASARTATNAASASLRQVIEAVRAVGVDELETEPVRVTRQPPRLRPEAPQRPPFVARQSIEVRTRDLDRAGAVIEAAVTAGANEVNGPRFTLANPSAARREAVAAAVKDARATARATAVAAGVELGELRRVQEGRAGAAPLRSSDIASTESAPPTEPGLVTVTAAVTATFAIE